MSPAPEGALGLSPRLRGNRKSWLQDILWTRSIPAPAGEPTVVYQDKGSAAVYPRACGGTAETLAHWDTFHGLSPRLRGNRPARRRPDP